MQLKKILALPTVTFFVLLIAIAAINTWQLVLPNFSNDNSFAIAAAKNISDGKGYTLTSVSPTDLSSTYYDPLNKWPPGYSWLLVIVKKITGLDWIIACYILNAMGATLLIIAMLEIFFLLQVDVWISRIYILFAGFVPYPFLSIWFSDLIATAFYLWAIVFLLKVMTQNKKIFLNCIITGLLLGYCAWLKYIYYSISFVPLIFFLFYSITKKKVTLTWALGSAFFIVAGSVIYMLWFQKQHSGSAVYINPTGRGFFPEHLLHMAPIVPASMVDFSFFDMQISRVLHIAYANMILFWQGLNVVLMIWICMLLISYYKTKGFDLSTPRNIYMQLAMAVSISIFALLIYLSISQKPYTDNYTPFWTYVQELRYYALILIFIPQGILLVAVYQRNLLSGLNKILISIFIFIAIIQIIHGAYYLTKKAFVTREFGIHRKSEMIDFVVIKTANEILKKETHLVICSDSYELDNMASLSGIPVLYDSKKLNDRLSTSKPVTLLVVLNSASLGYYPQFFLNYKPTWFLKFEMPNSENHFEYFYLLKLH